MTKKIKCSQCTGLMLPITSTRNDGICESCARKNRRNTPEAKTRLREKAEIAQRFMENPESNEIGCFLPDLKNNKEKNKTPSTSYHLATVRLKDDGSVEVGVGGHSNGTFWDGVYKVLHSDPDYNLWKWMSEMKFKATISSDDLPEFRKRFEKQSQPTNPPYSSPAAGSKR